MDAMNIRQGVLIELWDHDQFSKDDFLGEVWLPPLATIGPNPRQFVLPVGGAASDEDPTVTRLDPKKRLDPKTQKCTGNVFLEASWTFPAEDVKDVGTDEDVKLRVKQEEMLHTGRLYMKLIKAEHLRVADIRRQHGSDPYISVYIR